MAWIKRQQDPAAQHKRQVAPFLVDELPNPLLNLFG
jgi:hypothetical protein